ncbi:MAG: hypothetical protein FJX54_23465 [Alphaproteobacteria bacterium]|nr:hypothetical protein [Alphaproteobacteria bacterium]
MRITSARKGRHLMGISRDVREWAKEERGRSRRIAAALDDFAVAIEQHARLTSFALVAYSPAAHGKFPSRV